MTGAVRPSGSKHCVTLDRIFLLVITASERTSGTEMQSVSVREFHLSPSTLFEESIDLKS